MDRQQFQDRAARAAVALDRIAYDITGRKVITVAGAKAAHPGMASEIDRKFGGLAESAPVLATAV